MRCKLGDVCQKIASGGTPKSTNSEYYDGGNIPWLNTKEVNFNRIYDTEKKITELGLVNSAAKMIDENNVIIAMYGATAGHVAINKIPLSTNQACCNLKINSDLASYEYIYYYLLYKYGELSSLANGGAQQNLNSRIIKNFEIDLPNLETQRKIVRVLSALDQKIESNNQFLKQLSQISAVIFKNMYDNMSSSKELSLGEICNIKYGKNLPTKYLSEEGFPVYGANGIIGYHSEKMYSRPQVLVSCRGVAGAVHISEPNSFVTNNSLILECEDKFHYFIKEYSLSRKYDDYATGSAQPQITINNIKENTLKIPINDEELYAFNKICAPLEAQYFQTVKQIKTLGTLRDALLPKLMSGEINLEKVEI